MGRKPLLISFWELNGLYLCNFESPSPNDVLCHVWLKLAQWFCRRFLKFVNVFFAISLLSFLEKGHGPSFEEIWNFFTQNSFVPSFTEIRLVVLEKKIFKFRQWNCAMSQLSSLGKGRGPSFEFPLFKYALCLVWLGQWFWKKKIKM